MFVRLTRAILVVLAIVTLVKILADPTFNLVADIAYETVGDH